MTSAGLDTVTISEMLREGMRLGHMPFLTVTSGSMEPLLRVGDEVGLQPIRAHQLQSGDIVVIAGHDLVLTHRFMGLREANGHKVIVTRGDRVVSRDKPWAEDQLLARVVARRRDGYTLWLDFGAGRRLNTALARLSWLEERILQHMQGAGASHRLTYAQRLVLGLFRHFCSMLTGAVDGRFDGVSPVHKHSLPRRAERIMNLNNNHKYPHSYR